MKILIGDTVKVTLGKDKGRTGQVQKVYPAKSTLLVEGVNTYKKHVKGGEGVKGGIYELPRPLNIAKIALVCPSCKKVTRVGYRSSGDQKVRVCRKCGKAIEISLKEKKSKKSK